MLKKWYSTSVLQVIFLSCNCHPCLSLFSFKMACSPIFFQDAFFQWLSLGPMGQIQSIATFSIFKPGMVYRQKTGVVLAVLELESSAYRAHNSKHSSVRVSRLSHNGPDNNKIRQKYKFAHHGYFRWWKNVKKKQGRECVTLTYSEPSKVLCWFKFLWKHSIMKWLKLLCLKWWSIFMDVSNTLEIAIYSITKSMLCHLNKE